MLKFTIPIALATAAAIAVTAYAVASASYTERVDCPGKIVCPLNGELVCKDRCLLNSETDVANTEMPSCCADEPVNKDATRVDCPGTIVCPLNGELVCKDRCPLDKGQHAAQSSLPSCCQTAY